MMWKVCLPDLNIASANFILMKKKRKGQALTQAAGPLAGIIRTILGWMPARPDNAGLIEQPMTAPPAENKARLTIEDLTPAAIAENAARLLWLHRGSLTVELSGPVGHGGFNPDKSDRNHRITIPSGLMVEINEGSDYVNIASGTGYAEHIKEEALCIKRAWQSIQGIAIAETLGIEVPDYSNEPVDLRDVLAEAVADMVLRDIPAKIDQTYTMRSNIPCPNSKEGFMTYEVATPWKDLGGVWMAYRPRGAYIGDGKDLLALLHPTMGVLRVPYAPVEKAMERRKRMAFAEALGIAHEQPVHLPMPRGNAQAARVLRLCREAVAAEPELVDAKGTPIAPLVNRHLPELMRRHAEASQSAPADQLAAVDAELMDGIERVRRAVDEALFVSANIKRDALREQLAFLEMRHPDDTQLKPMEDHDA